MSIRSILMPLLFVALCSLGPLTARAGYPGGPSINMPVTTGHYPAGTNRTTVVSDGTGGAFVAWEDWSSSPDVDIYIQKLDNCGNRLWSPLNGKAVTMWTGDQGQPQLASDGAGGVTILWTDYRNGASDPKVYFDWIMGNGNLLSGGSGFPVCDNPGGQYLEDVLPKPTSFLGTPPRTVVVWNDERSDPGDLYLQVMDGAGDAGLDPVGVPVSLAANVQRSASMAEIGTGGIVIAWRDFRPTSGVAGSAVYAQRFNGSSMNWATDGIIVAPTMGTTQQNISVVSSLDNHAVIVWMGFDNLSVPAVYAQRLDQNGTPQWGAGVRVSDPAGYGTWPIATSDGAGGVYIAWLVDSQAHIQAQRIDASGNALWGGSSYGVPVMTVANVSGGAYLNWSDLVRTSTGVIVSWSDDRALPPYTNVYAQHLSSVTGDIWADWPDQGARICSHFSYAPRAVTDTSNGAVIVWQDQRNDPPDEDIYAQGVNADGSLGDGATGVRGGPLLGPALINSPNPFASSTRITFTLSGDGPATVDVFDVAGRRVFTERRAGVRGENNYWFRGLSDEGSPLPTGTYFYRVTSARSTATGRMTVVR
ncbi:MAG: T9SS type A sorting domain-containing protein [Candidatus Krumholzibacteria bacterium]|nr:T9SS type A sorting domain-containing protein [Candidatus Krumholzibacteria bacterium]MDH4337664.1 T9SS type A sorting domain-containing protein [Candidatus Krumholzibacteria bacterium]MDH5270256.1 T9SS type A sorting domain-containing protein [Candidatus Krumholzibacteria bacterium]